MKRAPRLILWGSILAALGLLLTLIVQLWFVPATLALFFLAAIPCSVAALGLFVAAVYRDALRARLTSAGENRESASPPPAPRR